jgi:hypothetical protein
MGLCKIGMGSGQNVDLLPQPVIRGPPFSCAALHSGRTAFGQRRRTLTANAFGCQAFFHPSARVDRWHGADHGGMEGYGWYAHTLCIGMKLLNLRLFSKVHPFSVLHQAAITFRLLCEGAIDLFTLARNARTSVDIIEKFYSSNLSAEMNIDLLQGRRR